MLSFGRWRDRPFGRSFVRVLDCSLIDVFVGGLLANGARGVFLSDSLAVRHFDVKIMVADAASIRCGTFFPSFALALSQPVPL